jgi:signal transduction histidine kinase
MKMTIRHDKITPHIETTPSLDANMGFLPFFNFRLWSLRSIYLSLISLIGVLLLAWSSWRLLGADKGIDLILLFLLAAAAEVAATFVQVGENKMAYEVGTAVSLAAIPSFGLEAGVIAVTIAGLSFWFYAKRGIPFKEKNWQQPAFNTGMHSLAIFAAGFIFLFLESQLTAANPIITNVITWVSAAIIYDQANFWLLAMMLRLVKGKQFQPLTFWRENRWAMLINILILSAGGFLLTFAMREFDWMGILIFFLPIILSSIAFQAYVRQMKVHMDNLEAIIAERTQELSKLMSEKDAFLAVLTHDMKSPLTTINLYANILRRRPDILQTKPQMTDIILRSQQSLTEIVNNILDLEKLRVGGGMPMNKERIDLVPMLEYVAHSLMPQAEDKNIQMKADILTASIIMEVDRQQIERVLQNLISNAIKYTPKEGRVYIEASVTNGMAVIHVQDSGYGIPEEELPYIFDRFHRVAKHEGKAAGTGLGLAITKALVEAHDGTIAVTSQEGVGSTFTVSLPVQIVD